MLMFGLDGEMSGSDLSKGHVLIQAGVAVRDIHGDIRTFSSLINPTDKIELSEDWWSDTAANIHGISQQQVFDAPYSAEVDEELYGFLIQQGANPKKRENTIMCGFNVGAFDQPFFRQVLPKSMSLFSRRTCDLNPLLFTLAGWKPTPDYPDTNWRTWKREAVRFAQTEIEAAGLFPAGIGAHDAGYDAAEAVIVYEYLHDMIHKAKF